MIEGRGILKGTQIFTALEIIIRRGVIVKEE